MTAIGLFLTVISLVVIWACRSASGTSGRGRALSSEELEQMTKECIGKSQKEVREIQKRYLYK